ncbi:ABC transporter permease [Marinobacter psychrophilus]|uniref:ABC transporter permease n=1 Tax=Marinobacter psychrophilus TaxID=330734 RepID=UPI001B3F8791|nr:ABC transporter permease [Marinobacter psychrophilus]MBQ0762183.1 ABC transporter permease [Marinobacter psychrophilus]MBQ0843757.1 ABC transporter permease [Marinobacter psychrophilus]
MLRLAPWIIVLSLVLPVVGGTLFTVPPAFGYLPVLGGDDWSFRPWLELAATPGILRSVAVSFSSGLLATGLALIIVFLFLSTIANTRFDRWIQRLVSPLLSIPHAAAAFGFAFLVAPSGLLLRWLSPSLTGFERPPDWLLLNDPFGMSLISGLVFKEIPFLLLVSLAGLPQLNAGQRVMLARSLGYLPRVAWFKTVAPALYPLIRLPVYAVLAFATSTVDVAMILGPNLPSTLSVQVVQWFNDPDLSRRFLASAGALLQLLVTVSTLSVWWGLEKLIGAGFNAWIAGGNRQRFDGTLWLAGRGLMLIATLLPMLGLFALALNSVAGFWRFPDAWPGSITPSHWLQALPDLARPFWMTMVIATAASALAVAMVLAALEHEQRRNRQASRAFWLLYLPLLVPQVGFLSGITVLSQIAGQAPALWVVVWAHLLFVLPYVYLTLVEPYRRFDFRWVILGRSLGISVNQAFWRIRLPMMLRPVLTAMALGLAISVSLYLPTQMLGGGRIVTVTTEAVALSSGGDRRLIGVWAMVQAITPFIGFLLALLIPRLLWKERRGMQAL